MGEALILATITRLTIKLLKWGLLALGAILITILVLAAGVTQKSTLSWPVAAPTRVAGPTPYPVTGWRVTSPFGWRLNPEKPGQWELHEGADLVGPTFRLGSGIPPMADVEVTFVGWDRPYDPHPEQAGGGVIVEMDVQHPEDSGTLTLQYAHLHPYQVWIRTQTCTEALDCPSYQNDGAGSISIRCVNDTPIELDASDGQWHYIYATPGKCTVTVSWPKPLRPDGPTRLTFDQQISPGQSSSDAALTFRARYPPPPATPTPTGSYGGPGMWATPVPKP